MATEPREKKPKIEAPGDEKDSGNEESVLVYSGKFLVIPENMNIFNPIPKKNLNLNSYLKKVADQCQTPIEKSIAHLTAKRDALQAEEKKSKENLTVAEKKLDDFFQAKEDKNNANISICNKFENKFEEATLSKVLPLISPEELTLYQQARSELREHQKEKTRLCANCHQLAQTLNETASLITRINNWISTYKERIKAAKNCFYTVERLYKGSRCPICLHPYDSDNHHRVATQCGHCCCQDCATNWFANHNDCPTCKAKGTQFFKIYI